MKIMITGAKGQLGREVCRQSEKHTILALSHMDLDIGIASQVEHTMDTFRPDAVINCASFTAVDDCEDEERYQEAYRTDVTGTENLARNCEKHQAKLMQVSTDYVFGGEYTQPISEDTPPCPINRYGYIKMCSEKAAMQNCKRSFVVRTAWLYGEGKNFVRTMLHLAESGRPISVVNDQIGSPTSTVDLTKAMLSLVDTEYFGIYHATGEGSCSWFGFAQEIFGLMGIKTDLKPISSAEFPRKAKRPKYSVLGNYKLEQIGFNCLRHWKEALEEYLVPYANIKGLNNS